jgi:hypothetical protein
MSIMSTLRLCLPEIVLFALGTAWLLGFTSELVTALGIAALVISAGVATEELSYRYHHTRQGRHGRRHIT